MGIYFVFDGHCMQLLKGKKTFIRQKHRFIGISDFF